MKTIEQLNKIRVEKRIELDLRKIQMLTQEKNTFWYVMVQDVLLQNHPKY